MPSASSCSAARTTSSTLRLWPRCTTSTPWAWISRRMMLIAASWPSNRLAAVTKRRGARSPVSAVGIWLAGVAMGGARLAKDNETDCNAPPRTIHVGNIRVAAPCPSDAQREAAMNRIPAGTWVVVADGAGARLFTNVGDDARVALRQDELIGQD